MKQELVRGLSNKAYDVASIGYSQQSLSYRIEVIEHCQVL